jgi:hypothetical protein
MNIPPPPWRANGTQVTQLDGPDVTQPSAEDAGSAVPPPPWKQTSPDGSGLRAQLDRVGATRENFIQQAHDSAHAKIWAMENGFGPDETGNYRKGAKPAVMLRPEEKAAIIEAHLQELHQSEGQQTSEQMAGQVQQATIEGNSVMQNFGGAMGQGMARFGTGVVGIVAPKTATNLNENIQGGYSVDPDSNAALAGGMVANTANAIPAMAAGPAGGALLMGGQTFGSVRNDIETRRRAGQNISTAQELTAAGSQAILAAGLSAVQIKALAGTPQGAAFLRDGVQQAIQHYAYNAGISALQGNVQQLATNVINNAVLGDNTPIEQGVGEATLTGAALGGVLTPLGAMMHGKPGAREAVNNSHVQEAAQIPGTQVEVNGRRVPQIAPEALAGVTDSKPSAVEQGPILEAARPKLRINDGATSRGVRVEFADPVEKALYVMGQPRQGKLAVEARAFLEAQGYSDAGITEKSAAIKARVEQAAKGFTGDTLSINPEVTDAGVPSKSAPDMAADEVRVPNEENGTPKPTALAEAGVSQDSYLASRPPPDVKAAIAEAQANVKGFVHELPANREQVDIREAFRKRGVELVYYSGEGRGVKLARNADNVLFINKKNVAGSLHEAVSHEFLHELKQSRPALYAEFAKAIPPEMLAEAQKTYNEAFNRMRPDSPLTAEKLLEEGVATIFGKTSKNSRVVNEILGKNPTLWQKITDFVRTFTSKFDSKSKLVNSAVETFRKTIETPVGGGSLEGMGETFMAGKGVKLAGERAFETSPSRRMQIDAPTEAPTFMPEDNASKPKQMEEVDAALRDTMARTATGRLAPKTDINSPVGAAGHALESTLRATASERGAKQAGTNEAKFYPGEEFINEDVKPAAKKIGESMMDAVKGIRSLVAPFTASKEARTTGNVLRERGAELAQRFDRVNEVFHEAREFMDKMPVNDSREFIDRMEKGLKQTNPELQNMADSVRTLLDDRLKQVQALGTGKLQQFITDYFPHLWKDPTKAANAYASAASKAPLEGSKGFLKKRSLPLFSDGIAKGLEPVTENPVEAVMLRVREMDKYITAQNAFAELNGKGLLKKITAKTKLPVGYAEIADNIAKQFAPPSRRGAIQLQSRYVAPEAVANVINNYLSPGLRSNKHFGGLFRTYLGAGNVMNQVQLGLSGFHLLNTTLDSAASKLAIGLKQMASGQFKEGGKSVAKSATLVGPALENMWQGTQLMKEWRKPGSTTPEIAAIVDVMKAAGGRIKMDDFYHTGMTDKMMEAFKKGNVIGGASACRSPGWSSRPSRHGADRPPHEDGGLHGHGQVRDARSSGRGPRGRKSAKAARRGTALTTAWASWSMTTCSGTRP